MTFPALFFRAGLLAMLFVTRALGAEATPPDAPARSKFRDPVDGQFDLSAFIDSAYGFVPVVIPITEPAVGYGAGGGLVFIDKQKNPGPGGFARPNISAVGGLATENGTWGAFAIDSRYWRGGRLQTVIGGGYASANLDYYGPGSATPLRYTLTPLGGMVQAKVRLGQSRFFGGLSYGLATTEVAFQAPAGTPGLPSLQRDSRVGGVTPSVHYDTRDNIFTPTRGLYAEASAALFSEALGGDQDYQKAALVLMYYRPLRDKLTLGGRGAVSAVFGDLPFYLRPFVQLRGVAAMRYQGDAVAQGEAELRWQYSGRYSLVGFGGVGAAWSDSLLGQRQQSVVTYGAGLRYELARKYGLHMGFDIAFGPDDPILYIQFGSAWLRP